METKTTHRQGLPVVHINGRAYFVDTGLGEFRSPGTQAAPAVFVPFETPEGRKIWEQCLIATCLRCGAEQVEPKHASGVNCRRCGAWLLV